MIQAKSAIDLWLLPIMSKLHLWMVVFDLPMAREVFNFPHKEILGETSYGLEVEEKPGSVVITFSSLRRACLIFDRFKGCESDGFIKQLIVSEDKKGVMTYTEKVECLQAKFHYGYWNSVLASTKYRKSIVYFDNNSTIKTAYLLLLVYDLIVKGSIEMILTFTTYTTADIMLMKCS